MYTMKSMGQVIHYHDDIFLIDSLVSFVSDAARLETDPEILGEAVYAVIQQADRSFRLIREMVLTNTHLVDRAEYLALLARSAGTMSSALENLLKKDNSLSKLLETKQDELLAIAHAHRGAASEMRDILEESLGSQFSQEDHVSSDEISELLRD